MAKLSEKTLIGIACAVFVSLGSGCATYVSDFSDPAKPIGDGLVYYMPKRPIIAQVAVTKDDKGNKIETPSLASAPAVPDLRARFVLRNADNFVGDNHITIGVNQYGLLTSGDSAATSQLDTIVQNAIKAAEAVAMGSNSPTAGRFADVFKGAKKRIPSDDGCKIGQIYNLVIWPEEPAPTAPLCGFTVALSDGFSSREGAPTWRTNNKDTTAPFQTGQQTFFDANDRVLSPDKPRPASEGLLAGESGVFFKTEIPYLVTFTPVGATPTFSESFVTSSPDMAPISFLPIKRTLFANNTVHLKFDDGVPTSFEQDNTGELVGVAQTVADAAGALVSVPTQLYPGVLSNENSKAQLKLVRATNQSQQQLCRQTIAANPITSDATKNAAAMTAIKSACAPPTTAATGNGPA